jgi:hypothetical protein
MTSNSKYVGKSSTRHFLIEFILKIVFYIQI